MMIYDFLNAAMKLSMFMMIGLYFIFSNTIIRALNKVDNGGIAMIEINRVILNPTFYMVFFLSAGASVYIGITGAGLKAWAGVIFFIGTFMVTLFRNVPLNNQLLESEKSKEHALVWQHYRASWLFWNHVRTLSAMISGGLLLM